MKIKQLLTSSAVALFVLISGCKKDTFKETVSLCPKVVSTIPTNGSTNVPLNQIITVTFNERMNPSTINQNSFVLQSAAKIAGAISMDPTGTIMSFTPTSGLTTNTTYTGKVTRAAKDVAGNALQEDYLWTFSTGDTLKPMVVATDPVNNETGVVLNKVVTATFNMPMDAATINASTFTLKQGINAIAGVVTYSGNMASFTPAIPFTSNTVYTGTITTGAKNIPGTSLAANYVWSFTTGVLVAPIVISTDPANNAVAVPLNKIITATFNMAMDPATISTTTFTVKNGLTPVTGIVTYSGSTATFTPSALLLAGTTYTGTITTGAKNLAGTALANNYVWVFNTGTVVAPTVISTDPINNATGVALNKIVTATFSVPMDAATITGTTFTLFNGASQVTGTVTYSGTTASFNPGSALIAGTLYTATITTGAKNVAGTPLAANYTWTFTTLAATPPTVISTDPNSNATNVALNKVITATFSVTMDAATITTSTFLLKLGANSVSGSVSYSGTTASFTPTANLLSGNTYTATITTGAKNLAGTALVSDYVWSFTTKDPLGPTGPDLKSALDFGILAYTGISNNAGFSVINDMNVGISPGARSSITGFPPAKVVNGAIYASDDVSPSGVAAMLTQAKLDLSNAYLYAEAATTPAPSTVSGDQGGKTLAPGIYKSTSTLLIQNGDLTLDAQGDANAVWIFQIKSAFTTVGGAGGSIILSGGAQAKNVYWQTGSSATIGDNTSFKGNVLAYTSITMNSNAVAIGRMLASNGAVVLTSTNTINKP